MKYYKIEFAVSVFAGLAVIMTHVVLGGSWLFAIIGILLILASFIDW